MPIPAPSDKRFRRAHVSPTRKRGRWDVSWKRVAHISVVTVFVTYACYRGVDVLLATDALTVTHITVSGNTKLSRGEVVALLDGMRGRNMVFLDLEDWRQKLTGSPWVADAALRRVLPGTVDVFISERLPMGIARIADALYLIDERGAIIDEFGPNYADFDLPIIDGLSAAPQDGGALIDDTRAALAAKLLASVRDHPGLAKRVSQIDVSDQRDVVVILKGDTAMVRVGEDQFAERLQSYVDLSPALRERVPDIDYVDLRFNERVYVRPQGSGSRPQKKVGGG
ncbi:MAG: FtsQ-type POTRA domain-containing protein [Acidobacteria bacterium]|nr:FtsQ-type POTRA domain-containing protein [Acidobacteriota bacterium]